MCYLQPNKESVFPYKPKQFQLEGLRNAQFYSLYHNKDLEKNNESKEYSCIQYIQYFSN